MVIQECHLSMALENTHQHPQTLLPLLKESPKGAFPSSPWRAAAYRGEKKPETIPGCSQHWTPGHRKVRDLHRRLIRCQVGGCSCWITSDLGVVDSTTWSHQWSLWLQASQMIPTLPFLLYKAGIIMHVKYKLAKAWDLFWCYMSCLQPGWWVASPAGPTPPPRKPWTHIRSFGSRSWLRGPWVWKAIELPGKHPSVKSILASLRLTFVLCTLHFFSYSRSTAQSRAGEEPLKPALQLTGVKPQNHSHCPKMLTPGFFCLVLSSTCSSSQFLVTLIAWSICLKPLPSAFPRGSILVGVAPKTNASPQGQLFEVDGQTL